MAEGGPPRHFDDGIPVLQVRGKSIALAWENALLALWNGGCRIATQYDQVGDPPSVDSTMMIVVEDPLSEPAIHRCFPGGLEDLEEYRMEFVEGLKDHWVKNPNDPDYAGEWTYTYSQRLKSYCVPGLAKINQVDWAIEALARSPHSRRVKLITWQPWIDTNTADPPCLGEFWLRCSQVPGFDGYILNGNVVFRSRDGFDAAFMNLWGEVAFMEYIAGGLQVRLGKPVRVGRLVDVSWSFHIYGKRVKAFEELFLGGVTKPLEDRTWTREFAQPFFDEARPQIIAKVQAKDAATRARADKKDAGLSPV
jgi:thymidylate synthase